MVWHAYLDYFKFDLWARGVLVGTYAQHSRQRLSTLAAFGGSSASFWNVWVSTCHFILYYTGAMSVPGILWKLHSRLIEYLNSSRLKTNPSSTMSQVVLRSIFRRWNADRIESVCQRRLRARRTAKKTWKLEKHETNRKKHEKSLKIQVNTGWKHYTKSTYHSTSISWIISTNGAWHHHELPNESSSASYFCQ